MIAWPTVPAAAPPLEAPLVELPSGTLTRRPGQRARRRARQPDRDPGDQRPGRARPGGCRSACSCRRAWGRDELLLDAAEALERANGRRWVESLPPLAQAEPTEA